MTAYARHGAAFCLLLFTALLVNAVRVQVIDSAAYDGNPANRRPVIARYDHPRGNILVGRRPVTGSRPTGGQLDYVRTYRDGPLYAPVTGFASQTYGATLVEAAADDALAPGTDVTTTIDPAAQRAAYRGLGRKKGAVAALDPVTGRILALVSTPSYDPGRIAGTGPGTTRAWADLLADPDEPMLNRALRQTYPPGSAFKTVTAVAALASGTVTDVDEPTDSPDPYPLPGSTARLTNESGTAYCRDASLRLAYQISCNTVFGKLGDDIGLPAMRETAEAFGFNDRALRIPSRAATSVFDRHMDRAQLAMSAIGQYNTAATPLQMAMVAAAVANGGTLMQPHIIDRPYDYGTLYGQVMGPAVAARMQDLMTAAVTDGTGRNAALAHTVVGGKTGTAQNGENNRGLPLAWFISWAHPDRSPTPLVAVAVVVEDAAADRADISGGGNAAPIARAVMRAALTSHASG
jgi:peptidoglycan glycosyltransferase